MSWLRCCEGCASSGLHTSFKAWVSEKVSSSRVQTPRVCCLGQWHQGEWWTCRTSQLRPAHLMPPASVFPAPAIPDRSGGGHAKHKAHTTERPLLQGWTGDPRVDGTDPCVPGLLGHQHCLTFFSSLAWCSSSPVQFPHSSVGAFQSESRSITEGSPIRARTQMSYV